MASIKYKTNEGYVSIPLNIIGSRVYLEDYNDGEVVPELVDDNAKLGNGIGTCSTSSGTALEVTLDNYKLVKNGIIAVTFEYDVPANATLNVNNKGAKAIYNEGSAIEANVIKAGKTVMFAYDGTNYVVTSLGGSGSTIPVETLNITLEQVNGNDEDLIGATITVYNHSTGLEIANSIWLGNTVVCMVASGIEYDVEVGGVSEYIRPNKLTYTSALLSLRIITFEYRYAAVDFGLPSGTLWSAYNLGATTEVEGGYHFLYGNTEGLQLNEADLYYDGFNDTVYATTQGYNVSTVGYSSGDETYDAAKVLLKADWRTPTSTELLELIDNTDNELVSNYNNTGVNVWKFTKKTNSNIFIVFPLCGHYRSTTNANGYYLHHKNEYSWIGSCNVNNGWYAMRVGGSGVGTGVFGNCSQGNVIRPVI